MATREEAILDTLQTLHKLNDVNIAQLADGKIQVSAVIENHNTLIFVGANGAVESLQVRGTHEEALAAHLPRLLLDALHLPPPQDVRSLIFSVRAALQRDAYVAAHVAQVQEESSCSVTQLSRENTAGTAPGDAIQLTTTSGVKCTVSLHPCYPQIPGCLRVETLSLSNAVAADEVTYKQREDKLRSQLNNSLYRTLPELVAGLSSIGGVSNSSVSSTTGSTAQ